MFSFHFQGGIVLTNLLHRIQRNNPQVQPGDSLVHLAIDEATVEALCHGLRTRLLSGFRNATASETEAFGAVLLLVGSRIFRTAQRTTYEALGLSIGLPDLPNRISQTERNLMERGARLLGIELLRGTDGHRRFRATMLFHSGGAWPLFLAVLRVLHQRFGMEALGRQTQDTLAAWIAALPSSSDLGQEHRDALKSDEAQVTVLESLRCALDTRRWLLSDGIAAASGARTSDAAEAAKIDLRLLFGAPSDTAVRELLDELFGREQGPQEAASFDWRLDIQSGRAPRLAVETPQRLWLEGIPADAQRVRLTCVGAEAADKPIFRRSEEVLEHISGPRGVAVPRRFQLPIVILAQYKRGAEEHEIEAKRLDIPDDQPLWFDCTTGRRLRAPTVGARIALAVAPGCTVEGLEGFARVDDGLPDSPAIWIGTFREGTLTARFLGAQGEHELLTTVADLGDVHLEGDEVPGLRFRGARCFLRMPRLRVRRRQGLSFRVEGPNGRVEPVLRRSEISLHAERAPGRYRVELEQDGARVARSFFLLPEGASFEAQSVPGATILRASVGIRGLALSATVTSEATTGELSLGADVRGALNVVVPVPLDATGTRTELLSWRVVAAPVSAAIFRSAEGPAVQSRDLMLLRGAGGIHVTGSPGAELQVSADGHIFSRHLGPDGTRFFPFSALPAEVFPDNDLPLLIEVKVGPFPLPLEPFVDSANKRPVVQVEQTDEAGCQVRFRVPQGFEGPVYLEALPVHRPWQKPIVSTIEAEDSDPAWISYSGALPEELVPYHVTLTDGARRLVGIALVNFEKDEPLPADLDPLEQALWRPDGNRREVLVALLRDRLRKPLGMQMLTDLLVNLHRYGARWFNIGDAIIDVASHHALEAILDIYGAEVSDVLISVFRDLRVPPAAIRYSDLRWLVEQHGDSTLLRWMQRLAPLSAGLLVPAWQAFGARVPEENIGPFLDVLRPVQDSGTRLTKLTDDELAAVITPPDELSKPEALSSRARGLVEARSFEERRRRARGRRAEMLNRAIETLSESPPARPDELAVLGQKGIPDTVIRVEHAVFTMAERIHAWRARVPDAWVDWPEARMLWNEFPLLLDHWLNRFAAQNALVFDKDEES
jgi:hypothetical protein